MKKEITKLLHSELSENIIDYLEAMGGIKINVKLDALLQERGINQKEFAELTGLRQATISNFINMNRVTFNLGHLVTMMLVLQIHSIQDILEIEFCTDLIEEMDVVKKEWIKTKTAPHHVGNFIYRLNKGE